MNDTCTRVAVVGNTTYPCHHHEAECHVFAADLPDPCRAPYCRLPIGHFGLHDIPSGRPTFADAVAAGPGTTGVVGELTDAEYDGFTSVILEVGDDA